MITDIYCIFYKGVCSQAPGSVNCFFLTEPPKKYIKKYTLIKLKPQGTQLVQHLTEISVLYVVTPL